MDALLAKLLSMGFSAGWLILAMILLRLVLFRAPKWVRCVLWALVGVRLAVPISLESSLSLVPRIPTASQPTFSEKLYDFTADLPQITGGDMGSHTEVVANSTTAAGPELMTVLSWVWLAGVLLLLGYALVSVLRLRRRVAEAVPLEGRVWQCDRVDTPFVLGVFRPRIYLPSDLPASALGPVLAHEQAHLARKDHWWKPLGFFLLAVYWFHPLVWAAYWLFCRDLELACDERVVRTLDGEGKRAYSLALLTCSVDRRTLAACPLAFGEGNVKGRIKAVLNYRRPTFWLVLAAAAVCIAAAVCFLTDPARHPTLEWAQNLTADQVASVDLVVMPQSKDRQYKQLSPEEIPEVVELLNQSSGRLVKNPETLNGQSIMLYLTLTDGSRHEVVNMGNVYLMIDGDSYDAPYDWLVTWEDVYGAGDSPLPEGYFDRTLTLEDVLELSQKGEALTWADLTDYACTEVGSGLYICVYPIEGRYSLWVGSGGPEDALFYANLTCETLSESVDIRTGDVEAFLQACEERLDRTAELFASIASAPAASSNPGDYLAAHPEEHQALLDGGTDTLRYIFSRFLAGGQTGLEGHLMRLVLDELAPEAQLKLEADTGQAYFDAWREAAETVREEHGTDWMEANQPAMWMMLQMSQAEP
ncbi:M56 family metallopeptidase [Intestinimonas massiliensis (ex Afouda et al. 2020)]|uniref:M56 family metallopeptidase n=1 Tax=Intestinimonas massiliensis (ex Afouda et al. 2020) TaxID=1673721 RepID=UPI0010312938|nr:M56 family metallopeptidase [Intestinimonas massiliensis (ex Afouda et al. 2020)]